MNATILNREFKHPADGWYQIEPKGDHPNRAAGIIQVIDDEAAATIVNRFNADAEAGSLRHGNELLIDHEHFSADSDKESRAYGWLTRLENRADGIYGQIRWTVTGKAAVDGGDYRFFSTEYDRADLKALNSGKPRKVRPLRLDGLSLTNMNNNRGQKPITNRLGGANNFPGSREPADSKQTNQQKAQSMKSVCTLLGLSAEADETSVHAAVAKIMNRNIELEPLATENTTLKNRITELDTAQVDGLLAERKITDAKVVNRLKPVLSGLKNREDRVAFLDDCGFKAEAKKPAQGEGRILNRGEGNPAEETAEAADDQAKAQKIRNRARELQTSDKLTFDAAWARASQEILTTK
jgi:phage I-like protein